MSKLDKEKEFIGYLKVVFGVLVAIDMSSVAWLFQHAEDLGTKKTTSPLSSLHCSHHLHQGAQAQCRRGFLHVTCIYKL